MCPPDDRCYKLLNTVSFVWFVKRQTLEDGTDLPVQVQILTPIDSFLCQMSNEVDAREPRREEALMN
jgi:hypothetical protein